MELVKTLNLTVINTNNLLSTNVAIQNSCILQNITVKISKNSFTTLIGESGSGKTMLSRTLSGLLPKNVQIESGWVFYNGVPVCCDRMKSLRGKSILYLPQNSSAALNPVLKIKNQLNVGKKIKKSQLPEIFFQYGFTNPTRILNSYPFELSEGESQRCLLVIASLIQPELLILDEPVSSLDENLKNIIMQLISEIKSEKRLSILFLTHDLKLAYQYSDQIYVIKKGEIVESGNQCDIFARPQHPYTKKIINESLF